MRALAVIVVFGSLLHAARVTFWRSTAGEYDFVIKGHLGNDHERTCGIVTKDSDLWDALTFKSGGAHVGVSETGLPLDAAKLAVEQDCQ